jgi:hypothetical protein
MKKLGGFNPFGPASHQPQSQKTSASSPQDENAESSASTTSPSEARTEEAEEEEDEPSRRRRIAEKMSKMGGFNPFGAPMPQRKAIDPILPEENEEPVAEELQDDHRKSYITSLRPRARLIHWQKPLSMTPRWKRRKQPSTKKQQHRVMLHLHLHQFLFERTVVPYLELRHLNLQIRSLIPRERNSKPRTMKSRRRKNLHLFHSGFIVQFLRLHLRWQNWGQIWLAKKKRTKKEMRRELLRQYRRGYTGLSLLPPQKRLQRKSQCLQWMTHHLPPHDVLRRMCL